MIEEAEDRYSNTNIDGIINKVANELNSQKETLVSYAISNPNNFSQEINEIVKNTLIYEIRNRIKDISNNIVDDFKIELKNLSSNSNNFEFDNTWIEKVSENTINLLEKAQNGLNTYLEHRKNSSVDTRVYKAVTTVLGITTSVINPLLEIVIIFLPDIINFLTAKSKEKKQKDEILNKISTSIIPQLKRKLRDSLPSVFDEYLKNTIETISQEFESQLEQKQQEIITTQQEKEDSIKDIEQEILKLETIKKELQTLTTQNLYR